MYVINFAVTSSGTRKKRSWLTGTESGGTRKKSSWLITGLASSLHYEVLMV